MKLSEILTHRSLEKWRQLGECPRFSLPVPGVGGGAEVSNDWCINVTDLAEMKEGF